MRDYATAALLSQCNDDILVSPAEISALTGIAKATVEQRRLRGLPPPIAGLRLLRWRLGDIRKWMNRSAPSTASYSHDRKIQDQVTTHRTQSPEMPERRMAARSSANTPQAASSSQS